MTSTVHDVKRKYPSVSDLADDRSASVRFDNSRTDFSTERNKMKAGRKMAWAESVDEEEYQNEENEEVEFLKRSDSEFVDADGEETKIVLSKIAIKALLQISVSIRSWLKRLPNWTLTNGGRIAAFFGKNNGWQK